LNPLLDTHAAPWFLSDDERRGIGAQRHLTDAVNRALLSAAGFLRGITATPFDRMLIALASVEGAAIVSRDEAFRPYGVRLLS
jgi:PIN domain nuclease of toxin-antitoxin system